ncbi:MAG: flagellar biosynthesis protein FliQ [Pseudobdellovibrionaceae bacterium]
MNELEIIDLVRESIRLCLILSTPVMMVGLVVGTAVALLQALTQIQETTLVFVPKIIAIFLAILVGFPFMATTMTEFMQLIADRIVAIK